MRVLSLCSVKAPPSHLSYIICSLNNGGTLKNSEPTSVKWPQKHSIGTAAAGAALSLGLLLFSPPPLSLAADSFSAIEPSPLTPSPSMEVCEEEEREFWAEAAAPNLATNEAIVQEAWEIVNESFLDTGRHRWSPDSWLHKKDDILSTSIKTRSKAHDTIRRMLASLGDPYTHFLTPDEFSKMARYDMTGIGINLREIPDGNGDIKLKVLGLILDGVAHAAGVRQD
ncbi:hypothetical protein Cgig2_013340 [Carnegiea gigantea]|uniref:C-terminal processing peptidase n=1 Tax=Carnegiea gigantea TaxID=171969 RepID=A0A9Q1GL40_9CARY|nr:hypothetical protein Cgig2_013340 [Carnegiea gigantea]